MDILKGLYKEFDWFIWGLIGIGVVWFFTGGTENESARAGQYIKPLAPIDTGEVYGRYYSGRAEGKETLDLPQSPADLIRGAESKIEDFFAQSEEAKQIHATSLLAKRLSFDGIAGAKASNEDKEYLRIVSSNEAAGPIAVSGLLIRGIGYDAGVLVPRAVELPMPGTAASNKVVNLPPGGRALVTTGPSPLGASFRTNLCTGYLEEFQDYIPDLRRDCPSPIEELEKTELYGEKACVDFVKKLPRCKTYQGKMPTNVSGACRVFITEKLNYGSCVATHKADKDFYQDEWRLFLGQDEELWRNKNEVIRLLDATGNVIDAITY